MKLKQINKHLSINKLEEVNLSPLTIITGLNGVGKSQLLEGIKKGSFIIDDINPNNIVLLTSQNFQISSEQPIDVKKLEEEYVYLIDAFKEKQKQVESLVNQSKNYNQFKEKATNLNKSILDLDSISFENDEIFQEYIEFIKKYKSIIAHLSISIRRNNSQYPDSISYNNSLLLLASKFTFCIHELTIKDFKDNFVPISMKDFILPSNISKIIWDYFLKSENFAFELYRNRKELDFEEFENKYGPKPWIIFNEILQNFETLDFYVNSPEGMVKEDSYKFALKSKINPKLTIEVNQLSSGEKILFSLVGFLYRLTLDNILPDIILFDEIDASLHPSMINKFLEIIQKSIIAKGKYVILATHSPSMIALAPENTTYLMEKGEITRLYSKSKEESLSILTEGYATLTQGISLFNNINLSKVTIISEGCNSKFIKKAMELYSCPQDINIITGIENITGKNQLRTLFDFFSKISHEAKVIFVWDCDVHYDIKPDNNTYPFFFSFNNQNRIAKKGIENLFDESLFNNFQKRIILADKSQKTEFDESCKREFEKTILNRNEKNDFINFNELINFIIEIYGV
jgi:predicted ATPase